MIRLRTEEDQDQIDALWKATDIPKFPTYFPEIVAERDGEIVGFMARRYVKDLRVLVEPMIAPDKFVYGRLRRFMEKILKSMGVLEFHFRIEPHRVEYLEALNSAAKKERVRSLGYHDGYYWFTRRCMEWGYK